MGGAFVCKQRQLNVLFHFRDTPLIKKVIAKGSFSILMQKKEISVITIISLFNSESG